MIVDKRWQYLDYSSTSEVTTVIGRGYAPDPEQPAKLDVEFSGKNMLFKEIFDRFRTNRDCI